MNAEQYRAVIGWFNARPVAKMALRVVSRGAVALVYLGYLGMLALLPARPPRTVCTTHWILAASGCRKQTRTTEPHARGREPRMEKSRARTAAGRLFLLCTGTLRWHAVCDILSITMQEKGRNHPL